MKQFLPMSPTFHKLETRYNAQAHPIVLSSCKGCFNGANYVIETGRWRKRSYFLAIREDADCILTLLAQNQKLPPEMASRVLRKPRQ